MMILTDKDVQGVVDVAAAKVVHGDLSDEAHGAADDAHQSGTAHGHKAWGGRTQAGMQAVLGEADVYRNWTISCTL